MAQLVIKFSAIYESSLSTQKHFRRMNPERVVTFDCLNIQHILRMYVGGLISFASTVIFLLTLDISG